MNIYMISDTHFYHNNIIEYCNRPFKNVEEMNQYMIDKWNNRVSKDDIVIHLGDVGFGSKEQVQNLCHQLNGTKILIKGNHDMRKGNQFWKDCGFELVYKNKQLDIDDVFKDIKEIRPDFNESLDNIKKIMGVSKIIISHYPVVVNSDELNIHGHIHNTPLEQTNKDLVETMNHICISVELIDYEPMILNEI